MTTPIISIFGMGYVGVVSAVSFAKLGYTVIGVDKFLHKVEGLNSAKLNFVEPNLQQSLREQLDSGRLSFTTSVEKAIRDTDMSLISVGTPSLSTGAVDTTDVCHVLTQIAQSLRDKESTHLIVMRSTVAPGHGSASFIPLIEAISDKTEGEGFFYAHNPEFLREGSALDDFLHPSETLIGCNHSQAFERLSSLYQDIDAPITQTSITVSEMVKYVDNSWHALKVSFANEIGRVCKSLGIDGHEVMEIFCHDRKLNLSEYYLKPGFAFGGSCLPKDLRGLLALANEHSVRLPVLDAILRTNLHQIQRAYNLIVAHEPKKVALLGVAFKPSSDDLRESPLLTLAKRLYQSDYELAIIDRNVRQSLLKAPDGVIAEQLGPLVSTLGEDLDEVIQSADVIVIGHAHPDFESVIAKVGSHQHIIDLVRICDDYQMENYEGIGWS
ncbi:nucleotide sugar dehydrogenase [Algicola sagamiensis]|uniref:nucleotide sugar dehydrogenase n=1 Tax=Algicola sagamiensis TaxID=163869 RepID=UPI00036D4B35|nr:nucleotide sugar dehydrogenase [Algicola sagamiensis]